MRMSPEQSREEAERMKAAQILQRMMRDGYGWEDVCKVLLANRLPYNSARVRSVVLNHGKPHDRD